MHQHERHRVIAERVRSASRVDVLALAGSLDVTPETIRRDLTVLERHGVVRRVHGGAVAVERVGYEPSTEARAGRRIAEKRRIAAAAVDLVPASGSMLLDAGTTTLRLAEVLPRGRELTVVTNSLPIASIVEARPEVTLHMLGGKVRSRTLAAVGPWASDALEGIAVDVAFLGTNGLTTSRGLTTPDQAEASTKAAMVATAARAVVLVDHTKIGTTHFARFARLDDIDVVISDTGLDDETAQAIQAQGPEVIRA